MVVVLKTVKLDDFNKLVRKIIFCFHVTLKIILTHALHLLLSDLAIRGHRGLNRQCR